MSIAFSFGQYDNLNLDESRISKMMQSNKEDAIYINLWERVKDFFRVDKKCDAYNELYNLIHSNSRGSKFDIFNKLQYFANPECQKLFTKAICCDDVVFFIGSEKVAENNLHELMGIDSGTPLKYMSIAEKRIFLDMLGTLNETEKLFSDYLPSASEIRTRVSDEHCYELLDLYRPQENIDSPSVEWNDPESLDYKESNLLRELNRGSSKSRSQFSFMGYQKSASGVDFSMLHPSINFLLSSYSKVNSEFSPIMELNTGYIKTLNKTYENYENKKVEFDKVLKKVYAEHGGTLNISHRGKTNNRLVNPPCIELSYRSQIDGFSFELNHSLNNILNKWINPKGKPF